jgi:hypothetical protein
MGWPGCRSKHRILLEDEMKYVLVIAAAILAITASGTAFAFHSGGVAECEGCHSMHSPNAGGTMLLIGTSASSTCLSCHQGNTDTGPSSYHISTAPGSLGVGQAPLQRTPGGDFGWLKKNYSGGTGSSAFIEDGSTHGHNIVAADFGYVVDPTKANAPGGTFPSNLLGCDSCHDPHGQNRRLVNGTIVRTGLPIRASGSYNAAINEPTATEAVGVYRLLAGAGYSANSQVSFAGVPAAKAPAAYNQKEDAVNNQNQIRVAYGMATSGGHQTWGNWCATCHPDMHSSNGYVHPVDQNMSGTVITNYKSYVKSGDLTGGTADGFLSLVPFVKGTSVYTELAALASGSNATASTAAVPTILTGPASGDQVSCLSCHRAHASGMKEALRFDNGYEFMTINGKYLGSDNTDMTGSRAPLQHRGRTMAEWQAAYYDRPATQFATYQRVLCNKCHAKD